MQSKPHKTRPAIGIFPQPVITGLNSLQRHYTIYFFTLVSLSLSCCLSFTTAILSKHFSPTSLPFSTFFVLPGHQLGCHFWGKKVKTIMEHSVYHGTDLLAGSLFFRRPNFPQRGLVQLRNTCDISTVPFKMLKWDFSRYHLSVCHHFI